jgi:methyl-accepting chemotaxis protein
MMNTTTRQSMGMEEVYRRGDSIILLALVIYALGAVGLGFWYDQPAFSWMMALIWTVALSAPGVLGFFLARGTLAARLMLAFSVSSLVALHIHTAMGMIEFHFGVFVTLALLLVYLDWRIIVFAAALFAVHHVVFDRLQAMGYGLYCLTEANFGVIVLHAFYVVVQTALQVFLVLRLASSVRDNAEVAQLAQGIREGSSCPTTWAGCPGQWPRSALLPKTCRWPVPKLREATTT